MAYCKPGGGGSRRASMLVKFFGWWWGYFGKENMTKQAAVALETLRGSLSTGAVASRRAAKATRNTQTQETTPTTTKEIVREFPYQSYSSFAPTRLGLLTASSQTNALSGVDA